MPVGTSINATPPLTTDTGLVAKGKLIDTLSRLITAVEAKVPGAAIDFSGSSLDLLGSPILNCKYVSLADQGFFGDPAIVSGIYQKSGEIYVMTNAGAVQLTIGGAINVSSVGAITGDYGGVNPAAVIYTDSLSRYIFTTDPGVYAGVEASTIRLRNGVSNVLTLAGSGTGTWTFPSPPGSTQLLSVTSAGVLVPDNAITGPFDVNGTVNAGTVIADVGVFGDVQYTPVLLIVPVAPNAVDASGNKVTWGGTGPTGVGGGVGYVATASTTVYVPVTGIRGGDTISTSELELRVDTVVGGTGTVTVRLISFDQSSATAPEVVIGTTVHTMSATGNFVVNVSGSVVTANRSAYYMKITCNTAGGQFYYRAARFGVGRG